ncbi:hypothetical protein F4678DRAFT_137458 [Xylaria arbuscula]|nr:hypothetical protein F4678DRAFT_137458 [Xylaria arbuscula]
MPSLLRPQTYPYASSSTGPYRGLLVHKYPCWDAQGPVRDTFTSEISGKIKECLEQCLPESNSFVGFSLFMVGKLPEKTKPTVMIVSDDKARRKAAFQMVKSKNILKMYPGFELGHCSVAAEFEDLRQLGLDTGSPESIFESIEDDEFYQYMDDEDGPGAEVLDLLSAEVCAFEYPSVGKATQLYFHTSPHSHSHDMATATCGGIFELDNEFYVLTMAHAIRPMNRTFTGPNQRETQSDSLSQSDNDFEITGMDDWDEDDDYGDTVTLAAITSPGSKTPSELSDSEESLLKRHDSQRSSETSIRTHVTTATSVIYEDYKDDCVADTVDGDEEGPQFCQRIGSVVSIDHELDIAIVKLEPDEFRMCPTVAYSLSWMREKIHDASDDSTDTSIVVKTTHHQYIWGQRSKTPFYTRVPGTSTFLELQSAQLSSPLRPGDSGSWAFNNEGDVVGLVLAGNPNSVSCLLLPIRQALQSMYVLLGRRATARIEVWAGSALAKKVSLTAIPDGHRGMSMERPDDNGVDSRSDNPCGSPPLITPPNPPPAFTYDDDVMTVASSLPPPSIFSRRMESGTPSTVAQSISTSWYDYKQYIPQAKDSLPRDNGDSDSSFVTGDDIMQDKIEKMWRNLQSHQAKVERIRLNNERIEKLKPLATGSEIQVRSGLESLRRLENLEGRDIIPIRENTKLKKATKQATEATTHMVPNGDDRLGRLASDVSQAFYGSDGLELNPSSSNAKKGAERTGTK